MSAFCFKTFPCSPVSHAKKAELLSGLERFYKGKKYNPAPSAQSRTILIVGAGPAGLRAAIECALAGFTVHIFESRNRFDRCRFIGLFPHDMEYLMGLGYPVQLTYKVIYRDKTGLMINDIQDVLSVIAESLGVWFHKSPVELEYNKNGPVLKVPENNLPEFDTLVISSGCRHNQILSCLTGQSGRTSIDELAFTEKEKKVTLFDLIRSATKIMEQTQGNPFKDLCFYRQALEDNAAAVPRLPVISFFSELTRTGAFDPAKTDLHRTIGSIVKDQALLQPLWGFVSNLPPYFYPSIPFDINDLNYPKDEQVPFDMIAVPFFDPKKPDMALRFQCESSLAQFDGETDLKKGRFDRPVQGLKSLLEETGLGIHPSDPAWQQFEKEECSHKEDSRNVLHFFLTQFDGYINSGTPVCGGTRTLNHRQVDYMIIGDAWLTPWFRFGVGVSDGWYGAQMLLKTLSLNKPFSDPECAKILTRFESNMRHRALEYVAMIYCIRTQAQKT
jgi:hypothetical protein